MNLVPFSLIMMEAACIEEISLVIESQIHWVLGIFKYSVCLSYDKLIQWQSMVPLPQAGKCHSAGIVHPSSCLVSSVWEQQRSNISHAGVVVVAPEARLPVWFHHKSPLSQPSIQSSPGSRH